MVRNFFCCSYRSIEYRTSTNHSRDSKNQLILDQADPNLADGDLYTQHKGHHKTPANSAPRSDRLFRFIGLSFSVPRRVNANRTSVPATSCIAILYCVVFLVFRWPISPVSSFFISLFVYSSLKFIALKVIIIAIRCALDRLCAVVPYRYQRHRLLTEDSCYHYDYFCQVTFLFNDWRRRLFFVSVAQYVIFAFSFFVIRRGLFVDSSASVTHTATQTLPRQQQQPQTANAKRGNATRNIIIFIKIITENSSVI